MPTARWLGHAAWEIRDGDTTLLLDPFITGNHESPVSADDLAPTAILVTHGHGDHLGDALPVARRSGAVIIAPFELAHYCQRQGAQVHPMHIGGAFTFAWGRVKLTQALHGSAVTGEEIIYTGNPCGFVITLSRPSPAEAGASARAGGRTVYFAGDTGLFGDMKLIGERDKLHLALLPIGGNFTMDIDDAVEAVKLLNCDQVAPMHYGTFPVIAADPQEFKQKVESQTQAQCVVLEPGGSLEY